MTKPTIRIHNMETDEVIDRDMTAAEIKEFEKAESNLQQRKTEELVKIAAKEAVLTKLGLTADEAAALLA